MVTAGKHHNSTLCHVATALLTRIVACWRRGERYVIRDCDGRPVSVAEGRRIVAERYTVPAELRRSRRSGGGPRSRQRTGPAQSGVAARSDAEPVRSSRYNLGGDLTPIRNSTGRSSRRRRCGAGSGGSGCRRPSSSRAAPGRTATWSPFNGKLRDEHLNVELFDTLLEAQVLTERWRCEYNQLRPHSSLGSRPPAPEAVPGAAHAWTARTGPGS